MRPIKRLWAKLCLVSALATLGGCFPAAVEVWRANDETPDTAAETEWEESTEWNEIQTILEESKQHDRKGELEAQFEAYIQLCAHENPNIFIALQIANETLANDPVEYVRGFMEMVKQSCPEYSQEFAEIVEVLIELG